MQMENEKQAEKVMLVRDIMTKNVISVQPKTPITEVAEMMSAQRIHAVPVVDDGKIVGIISETDFFVKNASSIYLPSYIHFLKENRTYESLARDKQDEVNELLNAKASDIMTKNCITILESMSVRDLLDFFRTTNFISLPVIDEKEKMVGIVSVSDIIGLLKA